MIFELRHQFNIFCMSKSNEAEIYSVKNRCEISIVLSGTFVLYFLISLPSRFNRLFHSTKRSSLIFSPDLVDTQHEEIF